MNATHSEEIDASGEEPIEETSKMLPKLDTNTFRWKRIETGKGNVVTIAECIACEISFHDINSKSFKIHR